MIRYCFLIFLCLTCSLFAPEEEIKLNTQAEAKVQGVAQTIKTKLESFNWNYVWIGLTCSISTIRLLGMIHTPLYERNDSVIQSNFSHTCIRNMTVEGCIMWECIPFFGILFSVLSSQFLNVQTKDHGALGFRLGGFMHLSFLIIEGGVLLKKVEKSKFKIKDYGIAFYVGIKVIKDSFVGGIGAAAF